jgi:opacity protein-like surface antigen
VANLSKFLLAIVVAFAFALEANAADIPVKATSLQGPSAATVYNWTGFYWGATVGAAWGWYDPQTSTIADGAINQSTLRVNAAGLQNIKATGFIGGVQAGYNWQWSNLVAGLEADGNYLNLNGVANSGAVPFVTRGQGVVSSYGHADWLFTLRPRIGWVTNEWLFYATGGLAVTNLNGDFALTTSGGFLQSGRIDNAIAGYVVGGGVEARITDRLSLKAEYLHTGFDRTLAATAASTLPTQWTTQSADLNADLIRIGLNYHFGEPDIATYGGSLMPVKALAWTALPFTNSNWEFEVGSRVWFSGGTIGAPQPLLVDPQFQLLASRLIYNNLTALSAETYGRVDHSDGLFVKGFLGAGQISNGNLHDEDFPAVFAYSNTLSSASGNLAYANVDLGYTFLRSPESKIGAFVGYNYYTQHVNVYSCEQLASDIVCAPGAIPPHLFGLAESNSFNSLRVGLSAQYMLTDKLKFTGDAAYLPWTQFRGEDEHIARELLLPQRSPKGDGVMLEAILGYKLTDSWELGVGGRYWAWNMRKGTVTFNFSGDTEPAPVEPARFAAERFGVFLQAAYHWGDKTTGLRPGAMPTKAPVAPMNWTGIYLGGYAGGGWSDDPWSDPFGSMPRLFATDIAGFGDTTHVTGPLGGGQINANWQTAGWVFGLQLEASATDLRGENTCFSGLGGINCQSIINSISAVSGRVGFAWNRSLIFAKFGEAWTNTTYNLNGNTRARWLGTDSTDVIASGWVAGAGFEYALSDSWTTTFEYEHVNIDSVVAFPTIALINAQNISIKQSIDILKLGINYKFNWGFPTEGALGPGRRVWHKMCTPCARRKTAQSLLR